MREGEKPGVKRLPVKTAHSFLQRFRQFVGLGFVGAAIIHITDQWVADMGHVHANLVRAAGFKAALHQRSQCRGILTGPNFSTVA